MVLTISAHHQPPPAAWPPCSPSRAPPPTTGAGPAARGTRTQDPGPTSSNDLEECFVSGARFDRGVHRDAVARVVAGESAAAVARDVGCRRGTVSQWCRDAGWSWSGGVRAGLLRLIRPDAPESSRPSWVGGGVNRTEFDGVVMRGEGITAVGLKEVLVGAAGAGHEDGRWRRWSPRVGPRGAIRRIAREPGASWGSAHLGAPGPGPDQGARPGITRWRGRRADQGV